MTRHPGGEVQPTAEPLLAYGHLGERHLAAARLHLARAELADLLDDTAARERHLREAHRLFTEMGATGHAERMARELEELA